MDRHFCFLQGNASGFFRKLGGRLAEDGARVSRINICGGDRHFWGDWNAVDYRGNADGFGDYIADYLHRENVTDIVLHNDCRQVHRDAIARAKLAGVECWVFEEGYLRPNWLTLEKGGINGFSPLPRDPEWFRSEAAKLPLPKTGQPGETGRSGEAVQPVGAGLAGRVLSDFRWQWENYRQFFRYPNYRTHRPYPIWLEYLTWAKRLALLKWYQVQARNLIDNFVEQSASYYVFLLQLDSDSQISVHSPFGRMHNAIEEVVGNFARHAPEGTCLVIKNHPLDNGWNNYRRIIRRLVKQHGVVGRVHFIDGGDLNKLIDHCLGVVTVNSTAGFTALDRGRSVICLGKAIFDVPGLTCQAMLEEFWSSLPAVDEELYNCFKSVVLDRCLINGNYYTDAGVALAVENSAMLMLAD